MELFERGMELTVACNGKLDRMEQKIKILMEKGGELREKDFSASE
jgi:exodeoxyribonuclease VII small subunit